MLMLVIIESTSTSPTRRRCSVDLPLAGLERSFKATLSAALVCCPTSPEDATYIRRRGTSRATTLLLDGRRPTKRATGSWSLEFAYAVGPPTLYRCRYRYRGR